MLLKYEGVVVQRVVGFNDMDKVTRLRASLEPARNDLYVSYTRVHKRVIEKAMAYAQENGYELKMEHRIVVQPGEVPKLYAPYSVMDIYVIK